LRRVPSRQKICRHFFKKTETGDAVAQFDLGVMYDAGKGEAEDDTVLRL
jgi:TPR repeat protein